MFGNLEAAIRAERIRLEERSKWLSTFKNICQDLTNLSDPWKEQNFIYELPKSVPNITKIGAVDGGVLAEAMTGFDLILYRAAGVIFFGIGSKVEAKYLPSVDPEPLIFFHPSLPSRFDFAKLSTLLRLKAEYDTAKMVIEEESPTILFLDGKVSPLQSDLNDYSEQSDLIRQTQELVRLSYRDLVKTALNNQVLLCGIVKDSRSSETSQVLQNYLPQLIREKKLDGSKIRGWRNMLSGLLDEYFGEGILDSGSRTAWLRTHTPGWLNIGSQAEIWSCLARPISDDMAMRLEVLFSEQLIEFDKMINIALGAYNYLCNHGLPIAIPTIISDADSRAKLTHLHLESIVDQISIHLGIPKNHLRKRRSFHMTLE